MARQEQDPITLAIDVGGTGVKVMLLNAAGKPISDRQRAETPRPATPDAVLQVLDSLIRTISGFDRVSVGFPGVVKHGATLTAHNLDSQWIGFDLQKILTRRLKKPVRVANDSAVQGFAAIRGKGV